MLAILVPLFMVIFLAYAVVYFSFRRWLKKTHEEMYTDFFGSFLDRSIRQQLMFQSFLFKKEYNNLADTELHRRCDVLRAVTIFYLIVFALIVLNVIGHIIFK